MNLFLRSIGLRLRAFCLTLLQFTIEPMGYQNPCVFVRFNELMDAHNADVHRFNRDVEQAERNRW